MSCCTTSSPTPRPGVHAQARSGKPLEDVPQHRRSDRSFSPSSSVTQPSLSRRSRMCAGLRPQPSRSRKFGVAKLVLRPSWSIRTARFGLAGGQPLGGARMPWGHGVCESAGWRCCRDQAAATVAAGWPVVENDPDSTVCPGLGHGLGQLTRWAIGSGWPTTGAGLDSGSGRRCAAVAIWRKP